MGVRGYGAAAAGAYALPEYGWLFTALSSLGISVATVVTRAEWPPTSPTSSTWVGLPRKTLPRSHGIGRLARRGTAA